MDFGPSSYLLCGSYHSSIRQKGLNNVIRELVNTLKQLYGIKGKVYGIQGGYRGFHDFEQFPPIELSPELVQNIHHDGGTVLGSSRGGFDIEKIIAFLKDRNVNQLYVIGGDGTHRGAFKIHEGCMERVSRGWMCCRSGATYLFDCSN